MAQSQRKKADDALLLALACGATVEQAARQCRLCARTVYRRLADDDFRRRLQSLRADMVQRTAGALTAAATEAVRTLLDLQKAVAPYAVRLGGGQGGAGDRHEAARGRRPGAATLRPGGAAGGGGGRRQGGTTAMTLRARMRRLLRRAERDAWCECPLEQVIVRTAGDPEPPNEFEGGVCVRCGLPPRFGPLPQIIITLPRPKADEHVP